MKALILFLKDVFKFRGFKDEGCWSLMWKLFCEGTSVDKIQSEVRNVKFGHMTFDPQWQKHTFLSKHTLVSTKSFVEKCQLSDEWLFIF